jgi:hypothetical protein
MMRQQRDPELEMELIPRQTSIGIDSSSTAASSSSSSPVSPLKPSAQFMSMNEFALHFSSFNIFSIL